MELGIGMFGDVHYNLETKTYQSVGQRLKEIVEEVKLADDLGIDAFLMGEHHRPDYAVPAPEIMLAALATVTKNIKLGSGVTVLSSADPVKVYQDFSSLDLMTDGRAEIVAGRGSFIESFPLFGYDLKDYNELFDEKLNLLLELNKKEKITWSGRFRADLFDQTIYPRPGRQLPVWIAVGGTPASVVRAAKHGLPIIFAIIGGQPKQFRPLIEFYKEQYTQFGFPVADMQLGVHSHTFVADSEEDVLKNYFPYYAASMDRIGRERGWSPYTQLQFQGGMSKDGALFMGNWEQVAQKIIQTIKMFGLTRFIAHVDVGGPAHDQLMKSIRLLGEKVFPAVRKKIEG